MVRREESVPFSVPFPLCGHPASCSFVLSLECVFASCRGLGFFFIFICVVFLFSFFHGKADF